MSVVFLFDLSIYFVFFLERYSLSGNGSSHSSVGGFLYYLLYYVGSYHHDLGKSHANQIDSLWFQHMLP